MNQRARKILSRIGVATMLGMSLFNFGAIWSNKQMKQVPRRAKNVRQNESEEVEQEIPEIALMADRHAKDGIAAEQSGQTETPGITGQPLEKGRRALSFPPKKGPFVSTFPILGRFSLGR